jgi:hypothetical protein
MLGADVPMNVDRAETTCVERVSDGCDVSDEASYIPNCYIATGLLECVNNSVNDAIMVWKVGLFAGAYVIESLKSVPRARNELKIHNLVGLPATGVRFVAVLDVATCGNVRRYFSSVCRNLSKQEACGQ